MLTGDDFVIADLWSRVKSTVPVFVGLVCGAFFAVLIGNCTVERKDYAQRYAERRGLTKLEVEEYYTDTYLIKKIDEIDVMCIEALPPKSGNYGCFPVSKSDD